ncbi:MAG: bifunctional methylenetetrahydrofolate dehydrogenase/methenyltetrahydrofolate cyclohydrolase [Candidatus Nanopelagicus sp.]|jgi:methylenetetrahydrofolate dehydrogenase (NADP+)/methenyltetrahydrofolate cyclohydrolase|nr:bifunctional methylenetetrahydrofolate dehydrogenase/methenyltetrahydrofolate cyclohydrolase [Candidatus Nanopelagicus sp.]
MSAVIMDGKALAARLKAEITVEVRKLSKQPGLGTILVGEDAGSKAYVDGKHTDCAQVGIKSIKINLPATAKTADILKAVEDLNQNPECSGFIVQLPLPNGVNTEEILLAIDPKKDADGLHPINLGMLVLGKNTLIPCTPKAILALLNEYKIKLAGMKVLIIGRGATVGRPLSILLSQKPINATVTLAHSATTNLLELLKEADVVVAALGSAHFIKPAMVKKGATLVDVGITRTPQGLLGDIDPAVSDICSYFAPMPGGVGPMTRAMLLSNLVELAKQ